MVKEYYEVLGVSEDASQKEIKKAYRKKAKKYHPDANSDTADEGKFKKINKAYDILSDEEKRRKYDRFGKAAVDGQAHSNVGGAARGGFADLFQDLFGGGGRGSQRRNTGQDMKMSVSISLEDAYNGIDKTVDLERRHRCTACDGTGAKDGDTTTCSHCGGRGQVEEIRRTPLGRARTVTECNVCGGRGEQPETACSTCSGDGLVTDTDRITFSVPKGIKNGQRLRVDGKGHDSRNGRSGDLYVFVEVTEPDHLDRRDDDLFTTAKVGIGDAALGGTADVETPSGTIAVDIPAGTQPGQVLRVSGKGMPRGGRRSGHGDLFVKVDVHVPEDLTAEQKEVLDSLRNTSRTESSFFETVKDIVT